MNSFDKFKRISEITKVADNTKMAVVVILIASLVAFTIMGNDNVKPIISYWGGGMFALLVICAIQDVLVKRKLRKESLLDERDS